MIFDKLDWDSSFFNLRVARLIIELSDNPKDVQCLWNNEAKKYDLIYTFCPYDYSLNGNNWGKLVDRKVVFSREIAPLQSSSLSIIPYINKKPNKELIDLAILSGQFSRFKLDTNFAIDDYKRLFTKWIENSVSGDFADVVFCFSPEKSIQGMITLKINGDVGVIGLIAVDSFCQSKSIGTQLINTSMSWLAARGIEKVEVATQMDNVQAMNFYRKQKMSIQSITNVYHWWHKDMMI